MGSHARMSPFGYLVLVLVIISPILGLSDDEVLVIILGRRVCRPRVSAFLFVVTTPPLGLGWLIHAGSSCLGGFELGPLMVLPR